MEKALQIISTKQGKNACLIFVDVDHLKEINDSFGHAAGDFAIVTAASYLKECMPENEVTARIGGDKFVCDPNTDLGELFKESDAVLYEQKRNRRTSIKKQI